MSLSTSIIPTEEQQVIITAAASRQNLLIAALAGTGKTSTLKMIAETYPDRRGLYLSYNKALQLEAKAKFPSHIDCKTVHGLAYSQIGSLYGQQLQRKLDNRMIVEAFEISDFRKGRYFASAPLIASAAFDMVKNFCYSTKEQIEPIHYSRRLVDILIGKYKNLSFDLSCFSHPQTFLEHFISLSYEYAQRLWLAMVDKDNETIPATHDIYLKLYQLSKPSIQGYEYIMLDEAQDANPSILNILSHQHIQRIYVGDKNQQIYEFRGTINAMSQIEGDLYYLTQSFRFGPAIATLANKVLKSLGETRLLKGSPIINSKIGPVNKKQPYAFLARTNAGLFEEILKLETLGKKVHFIGDIDKVIRSFESAYYLKMENLNKVYDLNLQKYSSWEKFLYEADLSHDHEYKAMIVFVETYKKKCLSILRRIELTCQYRETEADVTAATVHKAKGREWQQVRLHNDFKDMDTAEEKHILYVALTRASHVLDCPSDYRDSIFS